MSRRQNYSGNNQNMRPRSRRQTANSQCPNAWAVQTSNSNAANYTSRVRTRNGIQRADRTRNISQQAPIRSSTNSNGRIWAPLSNANNTSANMTQAFMQAGQPDPNFWNQSPARQEPVSQSPDDNTMILNDAETVLEADAEGNIFLVRDGNYYRLREDANGRIIIQTNGDCDIMTETEPVQDDQIHFFTGRGIQDESIVVNNQKLSGPIIAEMLRGPECAEIIGGLTSDPVDNDLPVAPIDPEQPSPNVPFTPTRSMPNGPVAPSRSRLNRNGPVAPSRNNMQRNGMNGMKRNGMQRNGMQRNGMQRNGMQRNSPNVPVAPSRSRMNNNSNWFASQWQ